MKTRLLTHTRAWILAAGLGLGLAAMAQEVPQGGHRHGGPAHGQQHAKHESGARLQDLKAKLKLTPAQESAWTAFEASMKPIASSAEPPKMEALAKMTAIQRMEERQKMHEAREKQHAQRMTEQLEAAKAFYAQLNTQQQATFDKETLPAHAMHSSEKRKGKPPVTEPTPSPASTTAPAASAAPVAPTASAAPAAKTSAAPAASTKAPAASTATPAPSAAPAAKTAPKS